MSRVDGVGVFKTKRSERRKEGREAISMGPAASLPPFDSDSPARSLPLRLTLTLPLSSFPPSLSEALTTNTTTTMSTAWYQLALRRYFRRSTFLLVLGFVAISYVALSSYEPYDDDFEIDSPHTPAGAAAHDSSPTGGSLPRPGSYGITDLKRAMGRLGQAHGGRQAAFQLKPEQKFTCDSCLSEPERCGIYGS